MGHRSLVALGKSKKNLQKKVSPHGLTWPLGPDTSTHPLTSDFFFFQKKAHGCSSHIPCFKLSCFAASGKQFENFRHRANDDKRLWAVHVRMRATHDVHVRSPGSPWRACSSGRPWPHGHTFDHMQARRNCARGKTCLRRPPNGHGGRQAVVAAVGPA